MGWETSGCWLSGCGVCTALARTGPTGMGRETKLGETMKTRLAELGSTQCVIRPVDHRLEGDTRALWEDVGNKQVLRI